MNLCRTQEMIPISTKTTPTATEVAVFTSPIKYDDGQNRHLVMDTETEHSFRVGMQKELGISE